MKYFKFPICCYSAEIFHLPDLLLLTRLKSHEKVMDRRMRPLVAYLLRGKKHFRPRVEIAVLVEYVSGDPTK